MSFLARFCRRRHCHACLRPAHQGDPLIRAGGYRIHRSHTADRASGFYRWGQS
jgi:hypothetical protein